MPSLSHLLFGRVEFAESEEYLAFQFRFLTVLIISGALLTVLLLLGHAAGANPLDTPHVYSMWGFSSLAFAIWLALRGHKERFSTLAWAYELICLAEYTSALLLVPQDELRMLWFVVNIPGVYILLGRRAGLAITLLSIFALWRLNPLQPTPYSPNAIATATLAILYLALFFHVYASRSISYFVRMRQSNQQLRELASHDPLTGILNARAYYARCDQLIRLGQRERHPFAVIFIDLDHFKSINDTHGHAVGDAVLKAVALILSSRLRNSDALGRIGGEEFSVFLPNTDQEGALRVGENLRQAIATLAIPAAGQHLRVTASLGVAPGDAAQDDMQSLQHRADQAMYRAKAAGRNRVTLFEPASTGIDPAPTPA